MNINLVNVSIQDVCKNPEEEAELHFPSVCVLYPLVVLRVAGEMQCCRKRASLCFPNPSRGACVRVCVCVGVWVCVCVCGVCRDYTHTHTHTNTHTDTSQPFCMSANPAHSHAHAHTQAHAHVHVHLHIHTHTHTHIGADHLFIVLSLEIENYIASLVHCITTRVK